MQDMAREQLFDDVAGQSQLFLVFLSDGAPSDHTEMECPHGFEVGTSSNCCLALPASTFQRAC